jgi:hypothetical protein
MRIKYSHSPNLLADNVAALIDKMKEKPALHIIPAAAHVVPILKANFMMFAADAK